MLNPPFKIFYTRYYITSHNQSLQPFNHDYNLTSHTTQVVCLNFIHERWNLQCKVDSERFVFKKLFITIFFTLEVFTRRLLRCTRFTTTAICQHTTYQTTATINQYLEYKMLSVYQSFRKANSVLSTFPEDISIICTSPLLEI